MLTLRRLTTSYLRCRHIHTFSKLNRPDKDHFEFFEPSYLESMKPKLPVHQRLNIQIRGFDFPKVEYYQSFVHRMVEDMCLDVVTCWGTPAEDFEITKLKPQSSKVETTFKLSLYHRTIQVTNVPAIHLEILLRALEASLPPGLSIDIVPHEPDHEVIRYVPDLDLKRIKEELDVLGGPLPPYEKKKKK